MMRNDRRMQKSAIVARTSDIP